MSDETHTAVWQAAGSLTFAGAASADFLQGYVTADCQRLSANALTPLALCTLKGRVLASGWAYLQDSDVVMIIHDSLLEAVAQWLAPYLRFAKCSISQTQHGVGLLRDPVGPLIYEAWSVTAVPQSPAADLSEEINLHLINQAYAWITTPTSQRFLPQMLGLDAAGAVDFNKGCYLGQEVVARAQFRGAVKRHLQTLNWSGEQPAVGSQTAAGAIVIAAATTVPGAPEGIALAVA